MQTRGYYAFYAPTLCMHTMILLFLRNLSIFRKRNTRREEKAIINIYTTFITVHLSLHQSSVMNGMFANEVLT